MATLGRTSSSTRSGAAARMAGSTVSLWRATSRAAGRQRPDDFNDDNIAVGGAYWVRLAERFLS
jgi:hypothetical protein